MSNYTHNTAPTQFVETNGIRFAYRASARSWEFPSCSTSTYWATSIVGTRR